MVDRLRWWCIPVGMLVLAGTVMLPARRGSTNASGAAPHDATAVGGQVVLRDAAGARSQPVPIGALTAFALVVELPAAARGRRGTMTVFRRLDGVPQSEPWLTFAARARSDGTVPIAGLAAGCYDVRFVLPADADIGEQAFATTSVVVPGTAVLTAVAAAAPVR
jgi:hypothetical protein